MNTPRRMTAILALVAGGAAWAQDPPKKEDKKATLTISVIHRDDEDIKCDLHAKGKVCGEKTHWVTRIKDREFTDEKKLGDVIKRHADTERTDKNKPDLSEAAVCIRGESTAPYGRVQNAMNLCANAGIYKIEICLVRDDVKEEKARQTWLPKDMAEYNEQEAIEEIRIFVRYDSKNDAVARKVGGRKAAADDKELLDIVQAMIEEYKKKKSRNPLPILIDARPDVPFKEIVHLVELFKEKKLERIEFAQPMPETLKKDDKR